MVMDGDRPEGSGDSKPASKSADTVEFEINELDNEDIAKAAAGEDDDEDQQDRQEPVDDDEDDDERLSAEERSDEDLTTDEKKRLARKRQRQRRNEERRNLRDENAELRRRLEALEGRAVDSDRQTIAQQIGSVERAYAQTMKDLEESIETGDGKKHAEAMAARDQLIIKRNQLEAQKNRLEQAGRQAQEPPVDQRVKDAATRWVERNAWFDKNGGDMDSRVVLAIDDALSKQQGADPRSDDYWKQLDREVRRRLPHKFQSAAGNEPRRGPPLSGRSDGSTSGRAVKVNLTPARKQVLIEMGVWGDKAAMAPYLKEFADFDRQNAR